MLGLQDAYHAFVVLHRFRQRGRSRVTDVVPLKTARIANETQIRKVHGIVLDQKERMSAYQREGKEGKRIVAMEGRKGREMG